MKSLLRAGVNRPMPVPPRKRLLVSTRRQWSWFLALSVCAASPGSSLAAVTIARPIFGVPEFAETGGTFRVEIKTTAGSGLDSNQWTAVLLNDLRSWTGTVEHAEYGTCVDNDTAPGYRLRVRVPADISPELYKLAVLHPGAGAATNRHSVSVVRCFETNFYILHYADPQANGPDPTDWDTGKSGNYGSIREMLWHAPVFSLINPRFVFDTGDEIENGWGGTAAYNQYVDAMCAIGAPVLVTRGNNDSTISSGEWRSLIGVETFSIRMGSFYVCQKDTRENNFYSWFTNDYARSFTNADITFHLFGQHYNSNGDGRTPCFYAPSAGNYPDLMLVGHGHVNATVQWPPPYYVIESQAAFEKGAVGFFQFQKNGSGWTSSTLANHPSKTWFHVMSAGSSAYLTCAYANATNGTATANTATIANNLAHDFWDGRVRFLMQHQAQGYQVTGGEKLAEYSYNGGANMAVLVKVNIAASATTVVSIQPHTACSITNLPATGVSVSSATLNANLSGSGAAYNVWVYWGLADAGANSATWTNSAFVGSYTNAVSASLSLEITGLSDSKTYYYTFAATNATTNAVAAPSESFITGEVTVQATDNSAQYPGDTGAFTICRPEGCTNEALTVAYAMTGTATNGVDYNLLSGSATILAGNTSTVVTLTPKPVGVGTATLTLTLTAENNNTYPIGAAHNDTVTLLAPRLLTITSPTRGDAYRSGVSNVTIAGTTADAGGVTAIVYSVTGATAGSGSAVTGKVAFIPEGAVWKYKDDGSDQGTAWQAGPFDDGSWAGGLAELGYGDNGQEATTNYYGPDSNNKYPTTYYRRSFTVTDTSVFTNGLVLRVKRDDGIVVYLNGAEIYRDNMPAGTPNYLTWASGSCSDDGALWWQSSLSADGLTNGVNTVAAEIHQNVGTSSDISFDLDLTGDLGCHWAVPDFVFNGGTSLVSVVAMDAAGNAATDTLQVVVSDDLDEDGMADAWEDRYFPEGTDAAPTAHGDTDGMNNLQEYVAGTDPTNAASVLFIADCKPGATADQFVLYWSSVSNRWYSVGWASNLPDGFVTLTSGLPASPPENVFTDNIRGVESRGFYRIGVGRQP